jgi:putative phage-type endonuclease
MTTVAELLVGVPIPTLEPGSPEWMRHMSASKIAAVVGLSPYESRFSLWHRMANLLSDVEDAPHLSRGHYLEDGVAAWFADQHPDWQIQPGGCWAHAEEPRFTASPDRQLLLPDGEIRGLELKTAADADEWGEPGTDEIPAGYKAQVQWQMLVRGTRVTHIAMLTCYLEFREYVVEFDEADAQFLMTAAYEFLDSLPDGAAPQRPDIDSHDATYEAIRQLHPLIEDRKVEVPTDVAVRYLTAVDAEKAAAAELKGAKSALLDAMALARVALFGDVPIARRQPGRGDSVSLYSVKG